MTKTELDIKLTEESLVKWKQIVSKYENGHGADLLTLMFENHCPLCDEYVLKDNGKDDCVGCPIYTYTGQYACEKTPYYEVRSGMTPPFYMVDFLTGILSILKGEENANI